MHSRICGSFFGREKADLESRLKFDRWLLRIIKAGFVQCLGVSFVCVFELHVLN
jgi:hypothetical protein